MNEQSPFRLLDDIESMSIGRSLIEYVLCDTCSMQIPREEAVKADSEYSVHYFCSDSCLDAENTYRLIDGLPALT